MGCSSDIDSLSSNSNFKQRKLKDFLTDDSNSHSSNAFESFPTNPYHSTIGNLIQNDLNAARKLNRSRSAFQAIINAVKNVHFTSINSPSILPSSILRKLSKKIKCIDITENKETKRTVTIKDIIRWNSFQNVAQHTSPPLDYVSSPHHCTTTTTTTTPCSSNGSSWCESDFTAEDLPCWDGDNEEGIGKKYLPRVGENAVEAATIAAYAAVGPKVEQKQDSSPVSVIEIKLNLEKWMGSNGKQETCSSYEEELESMDEVEEKAWQLYNDVKERSSVCEKRVVLDFFRDEISKSGYNEAFDDEILSRVKAWIDGEDRRDIDEVCVKEMDKDGKWSKFDVEEQELAMEIENGMVSMLVDELLHHLFYSSETYNITEF